MKYKQSIRKISIPSAAKINLHLSVLGKRTDGFHELLTVMSRLDLFDLVTLERTDVKNELSCRCLGFEELDGEKNLAFKAVEFWRKETGLSFGIKIIIRKRIPPEAGLGGGSSNAMATLVGLNHWLFDPLEQSVLHRIGFNLGSDCPFFLYNDCCVAEGRGEKIRRLRIPATRNLHGQQVFLFKPPIGLATAEVFQSTKEDKKYDDLNLTARKAHKRLDSWEKGDLMDEDFMHNSLEKSVFKKFVFFSTLFERLKRRFGIFSHMSGSGSCCFCFVTDKVSWEEFKECVRQAWGEESFLARARIL